MRNFLIYPLFLIGVLLMISSSCKKDDNGTGTGFSGTVKDIDGNVYHTVTIGTQVWMVENLKTTKYRNGDAIQKMEDSGTTGGQSDYNNNPANSDKYGKLYNWYAVTDSRNIAPTDWHIPTSIEYETILSYLEANLGTSGSVSKILAAKTDWAFSSKEAGDVGNDLTKNNGSGFTALPGGYYEGYNDSYVDRFYGEFNDIGKGACWWCYPSSKIINERETEEAFVFMYYYIDIRIENGARLSGFSVRCIKD